MKPFCLLVLLFSTSLLFGQSFVVRDIKSFGAKGNGKTNDHEAFQRAAAFFNERGGNGKLVISKGTYIVGKQVFNPGSKDKPVFEGHDLLHFTAVKNLTVDGVGRPVIRYRDSLRYGSFLPATGEPNNNKGNFFESAYIASIRNAIELTNCQGVQISNLELDGNSSGFLLGGQWGDVGRQLPHSGIWIAGSVQVTITNVYVHHFGLDGIQVSNATGNSKTKDAILIKNSRFEYNARQGLSWVGGNDLTAIKSSFSYTGKGSFSSLPTAGVDIEAEVGTVNNGKFLDCQFVNNGGCAMVADSGPSSDCSFVRCLFWGIDNWSVWVKKPRFRFDSCTFHGSIVHGYAAKNDADATTYVNCLFEDLPYKGKEPYGGFLVETNYATRMRFENCTFIANKKALAWMAAPPNSKPEDRYQLIHCKFIYQGNNVSLNDNAVIKDSNYELTDPKTKKKLSFYVDKKGNLAKQ